jgi:hypothetical protein
MNVSELNVGDTVYHVAHPDVQCKIMVNLTFQEYIGFAVRTYFTKLLKKPEQIIILRRLFNKVEI